MFAHATTFTLFALATTIAATLDPATSHSNGTYPASPACKPVKISKAIQAAECSHNTRTAGQTFAVFTQDHKYDGNHGYPYGTCEAYNCAPGTQMTSNKDTWTFFWPKAGVEGEGEGEGMGCIKSPQDGTCGCENSDGKFIYGGQNCK
ncbi:uncharacterized protein yc1106_04135 [Curvularia clavata]|uniref:Small secreted protein n=1 Tax=Curvularia clavata TaxID=95742 RepID=A0A9Q8Z6T5_CURCL|nr:uncharacterized protein yc1106_04135 [Curvularia clavata]